MVVRGAALLADGQVDAEPKAVDHEHEADGEARRPKVPGEHRDERHADGGHGEAVPQRDEPHELLPADGAHHEPDAEQDPKLHTMPPNVGCKQYAPFAEVVLTTVQKYEERGAVWASESRGTTA